MNKLVLALCLGTAALNSQVMADDCQAALDKVKTSLASADDTSSIDKYSKCKAYTRASLVMMDAFSVCKNAISNDAGAKTFEAKIKPLMEQLAHAEQTYCAR